MSDSIDSHPDTLDKLIEQYPIVFKHLDKTGYHNLPAGWYKIVDRLCSELSTILEEALEANPDTPDEPLFSVLQVKEKFGGLRFYYMMNTKDDELYRRIQTAVDTAEDTSYSTCQITGNIGVLCKDGSHFMTLCEESRISMGYKIVGNG
jgi:hypothetical protein